jgi:hypothetical protein
MQFTLDDWVDDHSEQLLESLDDNPRQRLFEFVIPEEIANDYDEEEVVANAMYLTERLSVEGEGDWNLTYWPDTRVLKLERV